MSRIATPLIVAHTRLGLANRIRTAASCLVLAERLGRDCRVIWPETEDLRCPFAGLFERPDPRLLEIPEDLDFGGLVGVEPPRFRTPRVTAWRDLSPPFRRHELDHVRQWPMTFDAAALADLREILYVRSCYEFRPSDMPIEEFLPTCARIMQRHFRPVRDILDRVMELPPGTVGVHLRRGDKYRSLRKRWQKHPSFVEHFVPTLDGMIAADPAVTFFVCSDDDEVKAQLRRMYPGRVLGYGDVVQRRDSVAGVRDALRDLYTLGQTRLILHDGDSSFGPIASRYATRPYRNMRSDVGDLGALAPVFWVANRMAFACRRGTSILRHRLGQRRSRRPTA